MHVKILQKKMNLLKMCGPAGSALFVYVSTRCVETVKKLDFDRYSQLTHSCCVFTFLSKQIICYNMLQFLLQF